MADLPQMPETPAAAAPAVSAEAPQVSDIVDLDGLSEFNWQGEKRNNEWLHKMSTEHQTYSQKLEEYEKRIKFEDNYEFDLENVRKDPRLVSQFKATYPKQFHARLDRDLQNGSQAPAQDNNAPSSLPKEILDRLSRNEERLNFHEQRAYQAEVQSANAKLDATLPPLFKKYELANEDQVYARAEALLQGGQKLTEKTWERLVRESHEAIQKKADQHYSAKLKTQLEAGKRGADVGPGGATPGAAPKKPRSFAEAQEAMIASLQSQRNG